MTDAHLAPVPVVVLGGSGYVGGELLRLLAGHPAFQVVGVLSESRREMPVVAGFPHLRGTSLEGLRFLGFESAGGLVAGHAALGLFSALPHGESAPRVDALLSLAEGAGCALRAVDLSADFRHRDPARYAAIYGQPHAAPARLAEFTCALPELTRESPRHVAHPGCFTTAATLALAPLVAGGWIEPRATVVAVTGSTGAGRTPTATTHHPERRSNLFAYSPLAHRHEPEMRALAAAAGDLAVEPEIDFVPHAGPFARGIHATISATLARPTSAEEIRSAVSTFYGILSSSFVSVLDAPPHLQGVVGTNRCDLHFVVRGSRLIAFSVLDNLVKGAAGGGVQWMNRLFSLPEPAGLLLPGLGWL